MCPNPNVKRFSLRQLLTFRVTMLLLLIFPFVLFSQSKDYLPLTRAELGASFKLKKVGAVTMRTTEIRTGAGPLGSTYRVQPGKDTKALTLQGQDKMRLPWHVDLFSLWGCAG